MFARSLLAAPCIALACAPGTVARPLDPVGSAIAIDAVELAPGTPLVDAFHRLRAAGVTNLNNPLESYIESGRDGRGYFALTGDQLDRLLIFVDGRFWRGQPIAPTHHACVHGVRVWRIAARAEVGFVVLSRGTAYGAPAGLQLVTPGGETARYDLTLLALENEGLRDPLLVGRDLGPAAGIDHQVFFTARRADNRLWPRGYLLGVVDGRLVIEEASARDEAEVRLCSCYQAWRDGMAAAPFEEAVAGSQVLR
ncbi:MAG: hypothetical protein JXR83_09855 [Deltaproteobacteria bacterium]|nr:hypothetical protein [Deltaproteobacteria bacterium]